MHGAFAPPSCYSGDLASPPASAGATRTRGRGGARGAGRGAASPLGAAPTTPVGRGFGRGPGAGSLGRGGGVPASMFAPPAIYSAPPAAFSRGGARGLGARGGRGARSLFSPPPDPGARASPGEHGATVRAEDLEDEPLEITRAELGLPPRICGRFERSELLEVRGPLSLKICAERRALSDADLRDVLLELRRVGEALYAAAVRARGVEGLKAGARVTLDVCCEENFAQLTDAGICWLVRGLLSMRSFLQPRILRLHANRIGDVGAEALGRLLRESSWPIEELHLSHNRITDAGFRQLLAAALSPAPGGPADGSRWPRTDFRATALQPDAAGAGGRARVPLWLRLEFNLLSGMPALLGALDARQRAALCLVEFRGPGAAQCDVKHCRRCSPSGGARPALASAAVHLPYINCQKMSGGSLLAQPGAAQGSALAAAPSLLPSAAATAAAAGAAVAAAVSTSAATAASGGAESGEILYLLLDTNALITLAHPSAAASSPLAFDALLQAAQAAHGAAARGHGGVRADVRILLIETVRQQLEGLKQNADEARASPRASPHGAGGNGGAGARNVGAAVRAFFSRQLVELSARGLLLYLDTAEVEDVARAQPSRVESPEGRADGRRDMDGRIVDCGLVLGRQLRERSSLLLVTDDNELLSRARNHGLATESLRQLTRALGGAGSVGAPWGAAEIARACSEPCRRLLECSNRAGASVLGPYSELERASLLGERAVALLRAAAATEPSVRPAGGAADEELSGGDGGVGSSSASAPETSGRAAEMVALAAELEEGCRRWDALARSRDSFQRNA